MNSISNVEDSQIVDEYMHNIFLYVLDILFNSFLVCK